MKQTTITTAAAIAPILQSYILSDFPQLPDGWVIMSIKKLQGGKIKC